MWCVAYSVGSRYLVTRDPFRVLVWETATGKLLPRLPDDVPADKAKSPPEQNRRLDANRRRRARGAEARAMLQNMKLPDGAGRPDYAGACGTINNVLESSDDRYLVVDEQTEWMMLSGGQDKCSLRIWDMTARRLVAELDGKHNTHKIAGFSSDGQTLLSMTLWAPTIYPWESATGRDRLRLVGHVSGFVNVGFRPDGRALVSDASGSFTHRLRWPA